MRAFRKSTRLSRQLLASNAIRSTSTATPTTKSLTSVLIANRGEIALRVGRTASEYGVRTTTLFTDPDAHSQHALSSPFSVNLGDPSAYLDGDRIIQIAKEQACQGIHPGYGFQEVGICTAATAPWLTTLNSESKNIMTKAGVPCIPGYHGSNQDPDYLKSEAANIGYPVLLKAVKGGGGKGMRIVNTEQEFFDQLASAKSEARNSFGDEVMLVEKYITTPRHIEVQVFADKHGNCVALGERDCSIQRRHQKILEESPAPHLKEEIRQDIWEKARQAALAVGYEGAGTVEFIFDNDTGEFFFMEMNTRLQVEHPVTEMVTGEDLVRWQLIVAEGGHLPLTQKEIEQRISERGHAIEARIYAENPDMNFIPDSGLLLHLQTPTPTPTVRIDSGFVAGDEVSSHYDPMISKLIVQGPTREAAIQKLKAALEEYEVAGPITNIEFIKRMCTSADFVAGDVETGYIQKHHAELFTPEPPAPEVYAQAALGLALQDITSTRSNPFSSPPITSIGFGSDIGFQQRDFNLIEIPANGKGDSKSTPVTIRQTAPSQFDITVAGVTYSNITSTFSPSSNTLTSFYPHTRLSTTFIRDGDRLTLFQRGRQYRLQLAMPEWTKKALGVKDVTNSVLAPMPCKVLRVEVEEGQQVKKDQPLVVIESMKMETVIRSPVDGVVKRVVHGKGDLCKAGTALVEFEDAEA
ncbi:carbamoyl-phosphate synthase L chain, ATP binding domain-containing protein [Ampelomyces quisqualis]|uniref:Carbamoyl-phosphate synthase L chain, ATP binding domain-containing protein n=1 Tax=Ampelomyces quisqualis TaxID=50730 RepID=A0A6A5QWZ4_AMPQU|nr:carbamoyl-phosphate synthase L chain, ATP binding domain-containing protein [Ampelomyces quisqualis]